MSSERSDRAGGDELNSIGLLELSSIAIGYLAEDAMLKAAPVELLLARTICSGKYIVRRRRRRGGVDGGGRRAAPRSATGALIEQRVIPHVHPVGLPRDLAWRVDLAEPRTAPSA